jgi:hypothetical protein
MNIKNEDENGDEEGKDFWELREPLLRRCRSSCVQSVGPERKVEAIDLISAAETKTTMTAISKFAMP